MADATDQIADWEESGADNRPEEMKVASPLPTTPPAAVAGEGETAEEAPAEPAAEPPHLPDRRRARSQMARPEDVPRINELTRRLRETEEELARMKGSTSAPSTPAPAAAPAALPATQPRAAAPVPPPLLPVIDREKDPEPQPEKYEDWKAYAAAQTAWSTREAIRQNNEAAMENYQKTYASSEAARLQTQWQSAVAAVKAEIPDFEAVAFAPTRIPSGSLIDAYVLEHPAGVRVLYHLQKNPADLDKMLGLPMLEQMAELALLTQRLTSKPTRGSAGTTGAVPAVTANQVPRPPTPVRTGPMRTGNELPGDDSSLEEHESAWYRGNRRRRA
jgi:hypothetical protein